MKRLKAPSSQNAVVLIAFLSAATLAVITAIPSISVASPVTHGRTRPLRQVYRTHQGWEYRTEHFIAVAVTSAEDARWSGEELETAWQETARLADHFGAAHRRPDFGMVGAIVIGRHSDLRDTGTRYPQLAPPENPSVIQVQLESNTVTSRAAAARALRRGAAAALLRQGGYHEQLPRWAADGLADFVADEPWDAERLAQERIAIQGRGNTTPAWNVMFRYLMTGDNGKHGATTLASFGNWTQRQTSMQQASAANRPDFASDRLMRRVPVHARWDRHAAGAQIEPVAPPPSLPNMPAPELGKKVSQWLANHQADGLAAAIEIPANDPAIQRAQEMALLVRLWERSQQESGHSQGTTRPIDLAELRNRLTSPGAPPWSVTDTDGRLLTWRDRERVNTLFSDRHAGYRSTVRDGRAVLEYREPTGTSLTAWLDRGADASRPVIRVQSSAGTR